MAGPLLAGPLDGLRQGLRREAVGAKELVPHGDRIRRGRLRAGPCARCDRGEPPHTPQGLYSTLPTRGMGAAHTLLPKGVRMPTLLNAPQLLGTRIAAAAAAGEEAALLAPLLPLVGAAVNAEQEGRTTLHIRF